MNLRHFVLCWTIVGGLLGSSVVGAPDDEGGKKGPPEITTLPSLSRELHDLMQGRKFADAVEAIDALLKRDETEAPDYLLYLKGRAQTELKLYERALATFGEIEARFPDGDWVSRARFGRADVLVRQRNYRGAAEIYQKEAQRLLSLGRKNKLAGIYLEVADRHFEGIPSEDPSGEKKHDYKQALTYYLEALKIGPGPKERVRVEFRIARCYQETKNHAEAIKRFQALLKRSADENADDALRLPLELEAEARYQLGAVQLAAGLPAQARKTWQEFLASASALKAGQEMAAQASYRLAHTYGVPSPQTVGDLELGVAAHEKFVVAYPDHKLAPQAEIEIARSYIAHGRHEQAVESLNKLIANEKYAEAKQLPQARNLLGQSYRAQKKYAAAIEAWKLFLEEHPTDPNWSNVQRAIIDTEYAMAADRLAERDYEEARKLWSTFLNKYPLDGRAPKILFQFGQMKFTQAYDQRVANAKAAVEAGDEDFDPNTISDEVRVLFEAAIADWRRLVQKYPNSNEASQAAYTIGVTLEDHLGRLEDALEAYKKVGGSFAAQAKKRIASLTSKQLEIVTERKFRSNETPTVKLTTRNVESVAVKVYRIDLEDFFRKMHLAGGVETLDIALIDPDEEIEYEVANYEEYRRLENDVEIPLEGPGVTAVTVSSEKLEATTMVVVSDLDLISKTSRNELFVFVEDMRTGKPAAGTSLLISDGDKVFAQEVTGEDGVLKKSYEELKSVEDLRIFAVREGHTASTVSNLSGLDFAVGLAAKGYLFTDRPVYRAGQIVNFKGIVRKVAKDQFTFEKGEEYELNVTDSRGRLIRSRTVALNDFGTVADNFVLPETAPPGDYRVLLFQPGRETSFETTFSVQDFQLEPVRLVIDLPRSVYYRGEEVTGTIRLEYYYGTPLSGKTIQYQLADGPQLTGTTDEKGEIEFKFPTRRFSESQPLRLVAQFGERNLARAETVYLATRGFEVSVSTVRSVFISGETFDATAKVTDPAGEPVATELTLELIEQTLVNGKRGERSVEKKTVKTDEESGEARGTFKVEEAGRYIVRATGTDQFENEVSGSLPIKISGEKDRIRLRILADTHHYDVGETASVRLHWREEPALALVTMEGASILGYRLVELKQGENVLEVPMEAKLAPNFDLAVAVMRGNKFHQARSRFDVEQRLDVKLAAGQETFRPGEAATITIETRDMQGEPVAAEVSLAMVQKSLLERFPDRRNAAIDAFFGGDERQPSVRAGTSCTFRYAPRTRGISRHLLAEAERERLLESELEARRELADRMATSDEALDIAESMANWRARFARREEAVEAGIDGARVGMSVSGANGALSWQDRFNMQLNTPAVRFDADGEVVLNDLFEELSRRSRKWSATEEYETTLSTITRQQQGGFGGGGFGGGFGGMPGDDVSDPFAGEAVQREGQSQNLAQSLTGNASASPAAGGSMFGDKRQWGYFDDYSKQLGVPAHVRIDLDSNAEYLPLLKRLGRSANDLYAVNGRGEVQLLNGLDADEIESLAQEGLELLSTAASAETAFWDPVIETGEDGKAEVEVVLPSVSTQWTLKARGIDQGALAGEGELELTARKDLFGQFKMPSVFVDGDAAKVLVEIHNSVVEEGGAIAVSLTTTIGEKTTTVQRKLESKGPGISELVFPIEATGGEEVTFKLEVNSGDHSDVVQRVVPIVPYGHDVSASVSGSSAQSTLAFVGFEEGFDVKNPGLEILIGPRLDRTLLDAVTGNGGHFRHASSPIERAVSDVIGGVRVLELIEKSRDAESPERAALAGRVQAAIAQLVSAECEKCGWSWSGRPRSKPDALTTSRVVWALATAREGGFAVPAETLNRAIEHLKSEFAAASQSDRERRAIILHGLATAGEADFAFANRLYRERNSLSASGLVHLALVLAELDRKQMGGEVLDLVKLPLGDVNGEDPALKGCIPWMQTGVELRALYLLALQEIAPTDAKVEKVAEWLLGARRGQRWHPEKANGPAIAALAEWFGRTRLEAEKYTLGVYVNDRLAETIEVDPARDATRRITVKDELLVAGKPQRINFDMKGRGRFSYSATLSGFAPAETLKSTTQDWTVTRVYEPDQRMLDGREVPRGFGSVTGRYTVFRNKLTQLPTGQRGEVTLTVNRRLEAIRDVDRREYLVVTEPLPAGTMVLEESVRGNFERFEISGNEITFYVGNAARPGSIEFSIVGYLPGAYRAAPTTVRSFYRPERMAIAEVRSLEVLGVDEESQDEYKLTPDEMYYYGKAYLEKHRYDEAHTHLKSLLTDYQLNANVYQDVVRKLFQTALQRDKAGEIVEYFEIIKEKFPEVEIAYDEILKVGQAYQTLGEYERCYLVFRATIEATFERESQIAGFLTKQGEFLRSVRVVEAMLREFPAEPYVAIATFATAQEVYGKASEAAGDERLKKAGVNRVHLIAASAEMLDHFLTTWPVDPAADQASFSLASALLDLENYTEAIERCRTYAERYPKSKLLDGFWYVIGYSQFALGRHEEALEMCRRVADHERIDPANGVAMAAANKWEAVYIMGQIYHSLGQPAEAIEEYERVDERFPDASEAIDFFTRKEIGLEEVTTIEPGEPAELTLSFRNVPTANVKVYRIDLLKFGLMRRNLDRITAINLAGIRPFHETTLELGDGKDYRDRETTLELPLKEEGAYLVVCRGENLYASGLALVSPLELKTQEDATSGRVRVTVKDKTEDKYLDDVHVKVIGSGNSEFQSGETDLRGIFVADAIRGTSTVIARWKEDRYAFYRGKTHLGPRPQPNAPAAQEAAPQEKGKSQGDGKGKLLDNVFKQNTIINREQRMNYDNLINNGKEGVRVEKAF